MTTIITRLYPDRKAARAVQKKLLKAKFREADVDVVTPREGDDRARVEARLKKARVHESAVPVYAEKLESGAAALVVRADYRPLGARRITREIVGESAPMASGAAPEEHTVKTPPPDPKPLPSVLTDHPHIFRLDNDPGSGREPKGFSWVFGLPTLTNWRPSSRPLTDRPGPILPFKTLDDRPRKKSVMEDHPRFSERMGMSTIRHR